jgi:hypothetical protein
VGVDTARPRMSRRADLDKIAPMGHEPYLELEESDCDAVEIQYLLCHNLRLDIRPDCVGHEDLDSGDVSPDQTQGESGWVVSVGKWNWEEFDLVAGSETWDWHSVRSNRT